MAGKKLKQFEEKDVVTFLKKNLKGLTLKGRTIKRVVHVDDGVEIVLDDKSVVALRVTNILIEAQED